MNTHVVLRRIVEDMNLDPTKLWVSTGGDNGVIYEGTYETQLAIRATVMQLDRETLQDLVWNLPMPEYAPDTLIDDLSAGHHGTEEEGDQTPLTPQGLMRLIVECAVSDTISTMYPPPTS